MAKAAKPDPNDAPYTGEIDGYRVRDARIEAPAGAPYGDIYLVIRRSTQGLNRQIDQRAGDLMAYMEKQGREMTGASLRRHVVNFVAVIAQVVHLEGLPGFDDWASIDLGMSSARLLEAFDRFDALDAGLAQQCINAVAAADSQPRLVMDPNSSAPSSAG